MKRPTQCKSPIAASRNHSKKLDHIHLININDRTTNYNFNYTFLIFEDV